MEQSSAASDPPVNTKSCWALSSALGASGLHGEAEPRGVLGVALAVDQHQRVPLVVLDDVRHAAEVLQHIHTSTKT